MDFVSKPVVIILATMILLMALWIAYLSVNSAIMKADLKTKDTQIMVLEGANSDFVRLTKQQEAEFALIRKQTAERAAKAQKAIDDAKEKAKRYEIIATNIANMKRSGNECNDAKRLVNTYLKANK